MSHFRLIKNSIVYSFIFISGFSFGQGTAYSVEDSYTTFKDMNDNDPRKLRDKSQRDEDNFLEDEDYIYYTGRIWETISLTRISKKNPSRSITSQIKLPLGNMLLHSGLRDNEFYIVYYELIRGKNRKPVRLMYRTYDFDKNDWTSEPIVYVKPHYELMYYAVSTMSLGYSTHPFTKRTSADKKNTIYTYSPLYPEKQDQAKISVAFSNDGKMEWHESYTLPWTTANGKWFQTLLSNDGSVYLVFGVNEEGLGHRYGYQLKTVQLNSDGSFNVSNLNLPFSSFNPSMQLLDHPEHGKILMAQGGLDKRSQNQLFYGQFLKDGSVFKPRQIDLSAIRSNTYSKSISTSSKFQERFLSPLQMYDFKILNDGEVLVEFQSYYISSSSLTFYGVGLIKFDIPTESVSWASYLPINHSVTDAALIKYKHLNTENASHIILAVSNRHVNLQENKPLSPTRIWFPTNTILICYSFSHRSGQMTAQVLCNPEKDKVPSIFIPKHCVYTDDQVIMDTRTPSGKRSILTIPVKL